MNKANECTCPSGDGSLVHPCPAHPAVEQAGGDERAADAKPCATRCPDCGEHDLMPGDLCACGYETDPATGYACSECDGSGEGCFGEICRECDGSGWFVTPDQARAALAQPSPDAPYADDIAADLERSDWTPEDALRWYAAGKHFDTVNGRTRIIDTGAVASNALKHLSLPYLEMKGDAELTELREAIAQPSPMRCLACRGDHGNSGLPCPNMRVTVQAQPSPKCVKCGGTGEADSGGVHPWGEPVLIPCDCETEQAEAERPEVVARVVHSNPVVLGQCGPLNANDELMTVAQHAASVARWAEMFNRVEQQRDAALARVAELERQEPVVRAYGVLPPFAEKVLAKLRRFYDCAEDFESGGVDIGRHWLDLLTQLGLLDRVQRSPALWEISQQGEDLLEAPVAQAQHSVPEGWMLMPVEPLLNMMSDKDHDTRITAERQLLSILAAAPGKEVGHE